MPPVALIPLVEDALSRQSPVAIGVSGGKDSQAAAIATLAHLDAIGHTGPRVLIHADLGMVEWDDSLPVCEEMARHFGVDLVIVRRKAGGLMERWETRWLSSRNRYAALETVTLVPCWSTPKMRFCTSELKVQVITPELKRRYRGQTVINVTGVRRAESASRSKATVADAKPGMIDWRPIVDWTEAEVFAAIDASGLTPHPAYREFGMSRVSCRFCIMSNGCDLAAAARQPESLTLYRRMVRLEADSTFAFQGARWLGDVDPDLLGADLAARLADAKRRAAARVGIESRIPRGMLFVKGWPTHLPSGEEAEILARVRRDVADLFGWEPAFADAASVRERYENLMDIKAAKDLAA